MRILFVKTSSLGDVIHHCPAVTDTRRRFPLAEIDWVVEEAFEEIPRLHPAIRRTIPVALRRWRKQFPAVPIASEMLDFHRALRADSYDIIVDTQGLLKSALITSRARGEKHGYDGVSAREPLASRFYDQVHRVGRNLHAVERNRLLTAAATGTMPNEPCDYGLSLQHIEPVPWKAPFCVLLSMTSRADKLWPEPHWAALASELAALGYECVFPWGSPSEQVRCDRIVALAGTGIVPRRMSLMEMASIVSQARTVFGVDTGLVHLAAALNVPSLGLYTGSDSSLTGLHGTPKAINIGGTGQVPAVADVVAASSALLSC